MSPISKGERARIANRHNDIPQDPLPGLDEPGQTTGGGSAVSRSQKSVRFAKCPHHVSVDRLTGLVIAAKGQLVFRDHNKTIGKHVVPCPGSGEPAPQTSHEEEQS